MSNVGEWTVGVNLKFQSNATAELELIAKQIKALQVDISGVSKAFSGIKSGAFKPIIADTKLATKALGAYEKALKNLGSGSGSGRGRGGGGRSFGSGFFGQFAQGMLPNAFTGGMLAYSLGSAVKDGIANAIKTSAAFQDPFLSTSSIMNLDARRQGSMYNAVMASSAKTGIGPVETMNMMKEIGRLTTGTMSSDQSIGMLDPVAKLATVLRVTRKMDPQKSTDSAIEILHLLRDYKPNDTQNMLNKVLGMSELMPQDLDKTVTQLKQFAPTLKNMGVSDAETLGLMVFMARAGLGTGRGGTAARESLLAGLKPVAITSYLQGQKNAQEKEIFGAGGGASFYNSKTKQFDEIGYLTAVSNWAARTHKTKPEIATELTNVFGRTGATLAQLVADPQMQKIFKDTNAAMSSSSLSVDSMFKALTKYDFNTQSQRLGSAWQSLQIEVTERLLPSIASIMGAMADALHDFQSYMHGNPGFMEGIQKWLKSIGTGIANFSTFVKNNPGAVQEMGDFFKAFAVLAGIRIAGSILNLVTGLSGLPKLFGMLSKIGFISGGVEALFALAGGLPLAVAAVIAAIGAAIFFPKQMKAALGWVGTALTDTIKFISEKIGSFIGSIISIVKGWFSYLNTHGPADLLKGLNKNADPVPKDDKGQQDWMKRHGYGKSGDHPLLKWLHDNVVVPFSKGMEPGGGSGGAKKHVGPTKGGGPQHAAMHSAPVVHIAFNAPIYGVNDLQAAILEGIKKATQNPMSALANNFSGTARTHANIPANLSVTTA